MSLVEGISFEKLKESEDLWTQATLSYLEKNEGFDTEALLEEFFQKEEQTEKEVFLTFKKAFAFAIFHKFLLPEKLVNKLEKLLGHYSIVTLEIILRYLKEDKTLYTLSLDSSGAFWNHPITHVKFPSLLDLASSAEIAFFSLLLAEKNGDENLFFSAKKLVGWIDHFFDEKNMPLAMLWTESHEIEMSQVLSHFYLLYHLLWSKYKLRSAEKKCQDLLKEIKTSPVLFSVIMTHWIQKLPLAQFSLNDLSRQNPLVDSEAGVALFSSRDFTSAISYSGVQSSVCELHCQDIWVAALGPKHFPIKELGSFGNFRPFFSRASFSDVTFHHVDNSFKTKGWIRITQEQKLQKSYGSKIWLKMESEHTQDQVNFSFAFDACLKESAFMISLFVKAKSCLVEQTTLSPSTLDHFSGTPPKNLSFRGKEVSLEVVFKKCSKIHVVPLSGKKSFWEATFLLCCEPSFEHHAVEFTLKKTNS